MLVQGLHDLYMHSIDCVAGASSSQQQEQRGGLGAHVGQPHRAAVLAPEAAAARAAASQTFVSKS